MGHVIDVTLSAIALAGAVLGWWRWARPRVKRKASERAAINEVLLGHPSIPANPITGAPAIPAKPSIGQLVADIHHELHPNSGESVADKVTRADTATKHLVTEVSLIKRRLADGDERFTRTDERLERIEQLLTGELHTVNDTVAHAAQASTVALQTIQAAIRADPPPTD